VAKQTINNGETGLVIRGKLNNMFTELYNAKSDNNYTDAEKTKLAGIEAGAKVNVQPDWNQINNTEDDYIKNKPIIPSKTSDLTNDSNFIVDADYVHTDNNYTAADRTKLTNIEAGAEVNNISDVDASELTGGNESDLHYHEVIKEQNGSSIIKVWVGTQTEYDALTPDSNTLYFIKEW